jgi:hypothetical protein
MAKKRGPKKKLGPRPLVESHPDVLDGTAPAQPKRPKRGPSNPDGGPNLPPDGPNDPPPPGAQPPLSDDEQRFVDEWLVDRHPIRAYHRVFPGASHATARRESRDLCSRPQVQEEMRAARYAQRLRCRVAADSVLEEMGRIAHSDILEVTDPHTGLFRMPRAIPLEVRRCIASMRVSRERRTVTNSGGTRTTVVDSVLEYKFWNKVDALTRLWEHLGLKTAIPPLESLLQSLPEPLRTQVRTALIQTAQGQST